MNTKKKERLTQTLITLFLSVSAILVIFPLIYAVSLSFQDTNAIYSVPPKFLPTAGREVVIQTEYDEDVTEDTILQDAVVGLFSAYFKNRNKGIDKYKIIAVAGGKSVFYAEAHNMLMQLEMDYGTYKNTLISKEVLLRNDRYHTVMDKIGYQYDIEGLEDLPEIGNGENELAKSVQTLYDNEYKLNADKVNVGVKASSALAKLENYIYYFKLPQYIYQDYPLVAKYGFFAFLFNTLLTVLAATVCQITLPALTAYPLAILFKKRTSNMVMTFFLITMMVPFVCIMIPQLVLLKNLGMYDNYAVMLFPWLLPAPFYIFLYKGFFEKIPKSYFEAAEIDGAGAMYTFINICLPLSKPIISLIAIQSFISGWMDFFWYYLSTKDIQIWTLNLAMYNINGQAKANFVMGLSIAVIVPVILVAVIFSKQIKQSVIGAGIKE